VPKSHTPSETLSREGALGFDSNRRMASVVQMIRHTCITRASNRLTLGHILAFRGWQAKHGPRGYEELLANLLQLPLFWKSDLHGVLKEECHAGHIVIEGMKPRQCVPNTGCRIRLATLF
jgi:hypothetical protein